VSGVAGLSVKDFVAPSEAGRRLGVSAQRVRQLIDEGRLTAVVTPLGRIVPVADVEAEAKRRGQPRQGSGGAGR
jgi:predicted site-specific integrase-resolvase